MIDSLRLYSMLFWAGLPCLPASDPEQWGDRRQRRGKGEEGMWVGGKLSPGHACYAAFHDSFLARLAQA